MNGFRIYMNLDKVKPLPAEPVIREDTAPSSVDEMLNLIYSVDPLTNMPSGALSQYLSEKTNEQVRQFIEQKILVEHDNGLHDYPSDIREQLLKIDSNFIAETSRNRYESVEDYEARVKSYFDMIESDKEYQKRVQMLKKHYEESSKK